MTDKTQEILDLIAAKDLARDHYDGTRRALEKAVWEAREKHNPQPGEAWRVALPYSHSVKAVIPAIKTARGWVTDPAYDGGDDLTDIDDGFFPESLVIPLERVAEAPKGTEGAE